MNSINQKKLWEKIGSSLELVFRQDEGQKSLLIMKVPSCVGIYLFFHIDKRRLNGVSQVDIDSDSSFEQVYPADVSYVGSLGGLYKVRNCFSTQSKKINREIDIEIDNECRLFIRQ